MDTLYVRVAELEATVRECSEGLEEDKLPEAAVAALEAADHLYLATQALRRAGI